MEIYDADNHYYEAEDAFTRHMDRKMRRRCMDWAEVRGRNLFLPGATNPIATDTDKPTGAVDVYVRPGDLRVAEAGAGGVEVRVETVQRTGPVVRATAVTLAAGVPVTIELPHLHHDVPRFVPDAVLLLRLMQFSVYPRRDRPMEEMSVAAPVLIGRERERLG